MKTSTDVKTGGTERNHNETLIRVQKPTQGLKVKTHIKAGVRRLDPNFVSSDIGL